MSISYDKNVRVVFLVQEGSEAPREATEEDFLRAGYVPAADRVHSPVTYQPIASAAAEELASENADKPCESPMNDDCPATCEDCVFLGENHFLTELATLPETLGDAFKDTLKVLGLDDLKGTVSDLFQPLFAPIEHEFVKFENEFSAKKQEAETEASKEEAPVEEKPEFSEFEQTVIDKFEEMGLGADAKSAMRKSKEFSEFLASKKPTAEQAKAFADLLKNGKPPFFI